MFVSCRIILIIEKQNKATEKTGCSGTFINITRIPNLIRPSTPAIATAFVSVK